MYNITLKARFIIIILYFSQFKSYNNGGWGFEPWMSLLKTPGGANRATRLLVFSDNVQFYLSPDSNNAL